MNEISKNEYLPSSPFPGIGPYAYHDRSIFFARDDEKRSLIRLIVMYRGVLLYAASGVGKSSLIDAGVIHLAIEEGFNPELIRVQPVSGEEIVIYRIKKEKGLNKFLHSIFEQGNDDERIVLSTEKFREIIEQNANKYRPLLIFDQFEEWVTLFAWVAEQDRAIIENSKSKIFETIISLMQDSTLSVKILLSFREDYLAELNPFFKTCPNLVDHYLRLNPIAEEQVYKISRGPFDKYPQKYSAEIIPDLAEKIQKQFKERKQKNNIKLTEVQIVSKSLYEAAAKGENVDLIFNELGIKGLIEQYYVKILEKLTPKEQAIASALLSKMVTSEGTRKPISKEDLLNLIAMEEHIDRHLLETKLDKLEQETPLIRRERRGQVNYYEIASEFLIDWIIKKSKERKRILEEKEKLRLKKDLKIETKWRKIHKRLVILLTFLSFVLLILMFSALWMWDTQYKEHITYYNTFIKRFGIPIGVGELSVSQRKSRMVSLKLFRSGSSNPVYKIQVVDFRDSLSINHNIGSYIGEDYGKPGKICQWEFIYDEKGNIIYELAYDQKNNAIKGFFYLPSSNSLKFRIAQLLKAKKVQVSTTSSGTPESANEILTSFEFTDESMLIKYDSTGNENHLYYRDKNGKPKLGSNGGFITEQIFNKNGLPDKITLFDLNMKKMQNDEGWSAQELKYDKLGNMVELVRKDSTDNLVQITDEFAIMMLEYDEKGNLITRSFYDVESKPVKLRNRNFVAVKYYYDKYGNNVKESYHGVNNSLVTYSDRYNFASVETKYDSRGNIIHEKYTGIDGKPVRYGIGYNFASWESEYDYNGNWLTIKYLGTDNKLILISNYSNYASVKAKYDKDGNRILEEYFSINNEPTKPFGFFNYSKLKSKYDEYGNEIEEAYLDVNNKPVNYSSHVNYASWEAKYDEFGNKIEEAYFDSLHKPVEYSNYEKYVIWRIRYDGNGNRIKNYFDVNGKLIRKEELQNSEDIY